MNIQKGKEDLENNKKVIKKILAVSMLAIALPALVLAQGKKKAVYFYSETCAHCYRVDQYFSANGLYDRFEIKKLDTSDSENIKQLNEFFDVFGIKPEDRGWPVVFFSEKMLIGETPITSSFISEIEKSDADEYPTPESVEKYLEDQEQEAKNELEVKKEKSKVSLFVLGQAALVDAINPCAFAVLILLVATVLASKGRNRALLAGLLFSLAVFISYFMMGIGLYEAISAFNLPKIFSLVIGTLAIIIGLANLKDALWYGKVFVMEVPFSWRPKLQSIIKKVTSPAGAFGAGFLVSLFLLPCTSGPYIVILGLLAERENLPRTISLLFLYNIIFVLPMVLITLGVYFGIRLNKLEEFRKQNIRTLHAIAGAIMLFIGSYLIYSWI